MLAPCLKAVSVRSFKITDWARALLKNTDYDLRSSGVPPPDQAQRQENDRLWGKAGKSGGLANCANYPWQQALQWAIDNHASQFNNKNDAVPAVMYSAVQHMTTKLGYPSCSLARGFQSR